MCLFLSPHLVSRVRGHGLGLWSASEGIWVYAPAPDCWLFAGCSLLSWFGFVYLFVVCLEETGQADFKVCREEKMIITELKQQEG